MFLKVIGYLELEDGRRPFIDWLDNLKDERARALILVRIDRVQLGNMGVHRRVGDGVVELKIDYGPGYRVYLGQYGVQVVILLIGGSKKTQSADILQARNLWSRWKEENS